MNLSDCGELRQTILARPPRLVRVSWILLAALLMSGVLWSSVTQTELKIKATGRVRPIT